MVNNFLDHSTTVYILKDITQPKNTYGEILQKETDLTKAHALSEQISTTEIPNLVQLPFELLHGKEKKTTKLLANSGLNTPINGSNRWYDYTFDEPVFLSEIVVNEENYSSFNEFEFKWKISGGGEVTKKLSKDGDTGYRAPIDHLVHQVSFRPPKKWRTDTKITRVQLIGFQIDELQDFIRLVSRLDEYKTNIEVEATNAIQTAEAANKEVAQAQAVRNTLDDEISNATSNISDLNANIGRLTEERKSLLEDIANREESISALDERRSQIQETIGERTTIREGLATDIAEQKQKLRALEDDVNMFPTELSAFVSQGGQNIQTYWKLAAVPIALLVLVSGLLVFNAANLTTVLDENDSVNIWSILITRIPYVLIATAIIAASYKLARIFVAEIMRINQQRLNLSKISIVATDVSNSSQESLTDLSDRDIYELRTDLKMQLLRDHLKGYISENFQYQQKNKNNSNRELEKNKEEEIDIIENSAEE